MEPLLLQLDPLGDDPADGYLVLGAQVLTEADLDVPIDFEALERATLVMNAEDDPTRHAITLYSRRGVPPDVPLAAEAFPLVEYSFVGEGDPGELLEPFLEWARSLPGRLALHERFGSVRVEESGSHPTAWDPHLPALCGDSRLGGYVACDVPLAFLQHRGFERMTYREAVAHYEWLREQVGRVAELTAWRDW